MSTRTGMHDWVETNPSVAVALSVLAGEVECNRIGRRREAVLVAYIREKLGLTDFDDDPKELANIIDPQDDEDCHER